MAGREIFANPDEGRILRVVSDSIRVLASGDRADQAVEMRVNVTLEAPFLRLVTLTPPSGVKVTIQVFARSRFTLTPHGAQSARPEGAR